MNSECSYWQAVQLRLANSIHLLLKSFWDGRVWFYTWSIKVCSYNITKSPVAFNIELLQKLIISFMTWIPYNCYMYTEHVKGHWHCQQKLSWLVITWLTGNNSDVDFSELSRLLVIMCTYQIRVMTVQLPCINKLLDFPYAFLLICTPVY